MKTLLSSFTVALTLLAGCGSKAVDTPTITNDLKKIAAKTKLSKYEPGTASFPKVCDTPPVLEFQSLEIKGQSCESVNCQVNVNVTLKVTDAMQDQIRKDKFGRMAFGCVVGYDRLGFGRWIGLDHGVYTYADKADPKTLQLLQPGAIRVLSVDLKYKKFDTGWMLQSY